jgi:beta-galactosidase
MSSYSDGAERAWRPVAEREFMAGAFVWTGFDYRGEPTPFGWPNVNSHFGIMDTCGFPKDDYYYYQAAWSDRPVLHLMPHWNWAYPRRGENEQNALVEVRCYTNCDQVELFVNGKSQGTKPATRTSHLTWKVKWNPGEISAKGWKGGKEVATTKVETAGDPASVELTADRSTLLATGEDVMLVTAQLRDASGRTVPLADTPVTFAIDSGDARLLGTGNGDPSDHTPDASPTRRTFHGRCLAVLRTGTHAGPVTLTASAPGLSPGTLRLDVRPGTPRPRVP